VMSISSSAPWIMSEPAIPSAASHKRREGAAAAILTQETSSTRLRRGRLSGRAEGVSSGPLTQVGNVFPEAWGLGAPSPKPLVGGDRIALDVDGELTDALALDEVDYPHHCPPRALSALRPRASRSSRAFAIGL
jgi:hypothetical protein